MKYELVNAGDLAAKAAAMRTPGTRACWRVYERGAVVTKVTDVQNGLRLTERNLDGWYAEADSLLGVLGHAADHGTGTYLVAMYEQKPMRSWKGRVAAIVDIEGTAARIAEQPAARLLE